MSKMLAEKSKTVPHANVSVICWCSPIQLVLTATAMGNRYREESATGFIERSSHSNRNIAGTSTHTLQSKTGNVSAEASNEVANSSTATGNKLKAVILHA